MRFFRQVRSWIKFELFKRGWLRPSVTVDIDCEEIAASGEVRK